MRNIAHIYGLNIVVCCLKIAGTVVGWGYDKEGNLTEELTMLNMPIVSKEVCVRSLPEFYPTFATNDTYCAGFLNGKRNRI